jgi:kynurenine formamidase
MREEQLLTEEQVRAIYAKVTNWGRWGSDDQRGTLNLIDHAAVLRGVGSVRDGIVVGLGRKIGPSNPMHPDRFPVQRHLFRAGDAAPAVGFGSSWEFLGMVPHGIAHTHVDALCHAFRNRQMYNGRSASDVLSTGAISNSITAFGGSVASRGILLDIPAVLEIDYLESDQPVTYEMLTKAEKRANTKVTAGDILLVRIGRQIRYQKYGPGSETPNGKTRIPGFYPDALLWFREREIAILGSDGVNEHLAFSYGADDHPIHIGCLVEMGLPLLHNADLDTLTNALSERGRFEFFCAIGLISFDGATSAPVSPVAIL